MVDLENFYKQFCKEEFDQNGTLTKFELTYKDNYNFGYDVVDTIAALAPDKRAMVWCNEQGEEKVFTYADISRMSNKAANLFTRLGIKKGDMVMLVLKRHYQYWFAITALHKIGAIAIPATNLLTKKDFVYRFQAADVKAIICTGEGEVAEHVDAAAPECPTLEHKLMVRGKREGWLDFDALWSRKATSLPVCRPM